MSIQNPKEFWNRISKQSNWRDYILPKRDTETFYMEGSLEAMRLNICYELKDKTVLDYGCGIGRMADHMAKRCKRYIGIDVCNDFINKAVSNCIHPNVSFYELDKYKDKGEVDFVFCLMVMQHNSEENRMEIVKNIHSYLKDGGKAFIQFPNIFSDYYNETDFVHKFDKLELVQYGEMFSDYNIISENLMGYVDVNAITDPEKLKSMKEKRELFLFVTK